jgi:hypothetical protein
VRIREFADSEENCVISGPITRIAIIVVGIVISVSIAGADSHKGMEKAPVRFPAGSTLVRRTWEMNEDTYLAELRLRQNSEPKLVRLIDV